MGETSRRKLEETPKVIEMELRDREWPEIHAVIDRREGPDGGVYDLERDKSGRHGRIMKYNLNGGRD